MKTYFPKSGDKSITHDWYIIDAKEVVLGKLAVKAADLLRGKHKSIFSPHIDTGDYVIILNAKDVAVSGKKPTQKLYRSHSGYFGHLKEQTFQEMIQRNPVLIIEQAVSGMLPKNHLRKDYLKKLKIYPGSEHPHTAQKPKELKP